MVFDGLKRVFNRIGGATIDSSRKVGGGVQAPVEKIGKIRPNRKTGAVKKIKPEKSDSKPLFRSEKSDSKPLFRSEKKD
jgi:archaeal flagellar protein FlaJ